MSIYCVGISYHRMRGCVSGRRERMANVKSIRLFERGGPRNRRLGMSRVGWGSRPVAPRGPIGAGMRPKPFEG
jgi:hypothetical protein